MNPRFLLVLFTIPTLAVAAAKPNLIIIMADDVGFSDPGCYGGEIQTPNLDRLAAGGVRFTQFYNNARCCPTRATLLTGQYPHAAGIGHMVDERSRIAGEGYTGELLPSCVTIAEVLRTAGYKNYVAGKWHVTGSLTPEQGTKNWPLQRGFDRFYGTISGAGNYWDPGYLTRDETPISPHADEQYRPAEYYYTDAISDHAARFIEDHAGAHSEAPFFLYVAYTAGHWPLHAKEADLAKTRGRYDGGYAPVRAARHEKAKQLGIIDAAWEMAPQVGDWEKVPHREWEARCMEVYAAMLESMDQGIGRMIASLEKTGQLENTLVLYLQDNGACAENIGRTGKAPRQDRATLPALPMDRPLGNILRNQTRAGYPMLGGPGIMPGPADTFIGYGEAWANVSNTPFREYKHWVHEGGIATPLIAHWPAGIPAKRSGAIEKQPAHLIDLMATALELSGASYPAERAGVRVKPAAGISLRPALVGEALVRQEPIFFEHEGNRAVRDGKWKLVSKHKGSWELYDMEADRTELHDLSASDPERVGQMEKQYQAWAKVTGVSPWPVGKDAPARREQNRAGEPKASP